jgi:hypothetical protein
MAGSPGKNQSQQCPGKNWPWFIYANGVFVHCANEDVRIWGQNLGIWLRGKFWWYVCLCVCVHVYVGVCMWETEKKQKQEGKKASLFYRSRVKKRWYCVVEMLSWKQKVITLPFLQISSGIICSSKLCDCEVILFHQMVWIWLNE